MGDHLCCYGHPTVRSPHLDRLAQQGVRFTNYFTTAPECTSSRGGMLTGLYAHQNGLVGLAGFGWHIPPDVAHLAQVLRDGRHVPPTERQRDLARRCKPGRPQFRKCVAGRARTK